MAFAFDSADGLGGKNELPMMPQSYFFAVDSN